MIYPNSDNRETLQWSSWNSKLGQSKGVGEERRNRGEVKRANDLGHEELVRAGRTKRNRGVICWY